MIAFREITIQEIDIIKKYLKQNDNMACEFSLANIYMWNVENKIKYAIVMEQIVFRKIEDENAIYSIVVQNKNLKDLLLILMEDAKMEQKKFAMNGISEAMKTEISQLFEGQFEFHTNRNNSDYIYKVQDLTTLPGKKYHGKKNHINQFLQNVTFQYEEITKDNLDECYQMKEFWKTQNDGEDPSIALESNAVDIALKYFFILGLVGGLIRIDGEVKAFTIGEQLNHETFVTHIEKADYTIRGLYPMINQQFAIHQLQSYVFVNREEDLGLEGLRKAKLSYQPCQIWDKYSLRMV